MCKIIFLYYIDFIIVFSFAKIKSKMFGIAVEAACVMTKDCYGGQLPLLVDVPIGAIRLLIFVMHIF